MEWQFARIKRPISIRRMQLWQCITTQYRLTTVPGIIYVPKWGGANSTQALGSTPIHVTSNDVIEHKEIKVRIYKLVS